MATKRAKRAPAKTSKRKSSAKWSANVTAGSDAMDLEAGVFKKRSARQIALSRSVESASLKANVG